MAEAGQIEPPRQAWCAGLAQVGTRALDDYELRSVRRRILTVRRAGQLAVLYAASTVTAAGAVALWTVEDWPARAAMAIGLGLGSFALPGLLLALLGRHTERRLLAATGSLFLVLFLVGDHLAQTHLGRSAGPWLWHLTWNVSAALGLLGLFTAYRGARALWAARGQARLAQVDLGERSCERYEGPLPHQVHPLLQGLARDCALAPTDCHRIEVLPRSRVVVRANGHPVRRWRIARRADLAAPRPHALRVPIRTRTPSPDVALHRRALSPEERQEIRAHARSLGREVGPVVAGVGAALAFVAVEVVAFGAEAQLFGAGAIIWYGFALVTILRYALRRRAAGHLRRDAQLQWLVSVHEKEVDPADGLPRMEVLPHSQLLWTEGDRPALWRGSS